MEKNKRVDVKLQNGFEYEPFGNTV